MPVKAIDNIQTADVPNADSPSTISMPAIAQQPAIRESHVFLEKINAERDAAVREIDKIDATVRAWMDRRNDLQSIVDGCERVLNGVPNKESGE